MEIPIHFSGELAGMAGRLQAARDDTSHMSRVLLQRTLVKMSAHICALSTHGAMPAAGGTSSW